VLDAIRRRPNITANEIAGVIGLSYRRAVEIVVALADDDLIGWKMLPPEKGVSRCPRRAYFIGASQNGGIPEMWTVMAHFFGITAEPAAA
jgi:hypothetical protein